MQPQLSPVMRQILKFSRTLRLPLSKMEIAALTRQVDHRAGSRTPGGSVDHAGRGNVLEGGSGGIKDDGFARAVAAGFSPGDDVAQFTRNMIAGDQARRYGVVSVPYMDDLLDQVSKDSGLGNEARIKHL